MTREEEDRKIDEAIARTFEKMKELAQLVDRIEAKEKEGQELSEAEKSLLEKARQGFPGIGLRLG